MTHTPSLSVSTFSLHRTLSVTYGDAPGHGAERPRSEPFGPGEITLMELPARIAAMGIHKLEISHPHLPSREAGYLNELRAALAEADVQLLSVLVENGDLTHPEHAERDLHWMAGWVETAGLLGAERARVIAGKAAPTAETLARSQRGLQQLVSVGKDHNVRVTTENWFDLLSTPATVLDLMSRLEGQVGFNLDFGNWGGPTKYDDLAAIFPLAESCHAKCRFTAPYVPDEYDFNRCLDLSRAAHFTGPYTLIYDGPGEDEWRGLTLEREMVAPYLH